SLVAWLILAGLLILFGLFIWESRLEREGKEPLVRPSMFRNRQLVVGLTMILFQYFIQAGIFFTIPLFLSIVLELSALQTGIRLIPLSLALLHSWCRQSRFHGSGQRRHHDAWCVCDCSCFW